MYYGTFQFPNLMLNLHPDCAMYYIAFPHGREPHDRRVGVPVPVRDDRSAATSSRIRWSSSGTSSRGRTGRSANGPRRACARAPSRPASSRARTDSCSTSTSSTAARWADRRSAEPVRRRRPAGPRDGRTLSAATYAGGVALDEPAVALAPGELAVADDDAAAAHARCRCRPGRRGPRSTSSRRPCGASPRRSCAAGPGRR